MNKERIVFFILLIATFGIMVSIFGLGYTSSSLKTFDDITESREACFVRCDSVMTDLVETGDEVLDNAFIQSCYVGCNEFIGSYIEVTK